MDSNPSQVLRSYYLKITEKIRDFKTDKEYRNGRFQHIQFVPTFYYLESQFFKTHFSLKKYIFNKISVYVFTGIIMALNRLYRGSKVHQRPRRTGRFEKRLQKSGPELVFRSQTFIKYRILETIFVENLIVIWWSITIRNCENSIARTC